MNFSDLIQWIKDLLVIFSLIGAAWSAYVFIQKLQDDKETIRKLKLANWRKASVQKLLHNDPDFLSAKEITDKLRSSSFETDFPIEKTELTEQEVRLLLIEMIRDDVLIQIHGDKYGVKQHRFDVGAVAIEEQLRGHRAAKAAFELIVKYPSHYTDDSLFSEVGKANNVSKPEFLIAIADLENRNLAYRDKDGKWENGKTQVEEN